MHVPEDEEYRRTVREREQARAEAAREPKEEVARAADLDAGGVPARLYVPVGLDPATPYARGVIVHLHGGGFVFNDVEVHDAPARRLANRTGRAVVSVDYRLAPEHPFPAAVEDADAALAWAGEQGGPVVLHGDSAGGNLALVAALHRPGAAAALVLVYPFLDPAGSFASYEQTGGTWDRAEAQWYWRQYVDLAADPTLLEHPDVAPLRSPALATLPPTLILTAGDDIARDEGEHLLKLLQAAGVEAVGSRYLAVPHAFWRSAEHRTAADLAMRQTGAFLDGLLAPGERRSDPRQPRGLA